MEEDRALALARELNNRGVNCRLDRDARSRYRLRVALQPDHEALWDLYTGLLEARVTRGGALVGFVPLPVPTVVSEQALAGLIAAQRYEQLSTSSRSGSRADPGKRLGGPRGAASRRRLPVLWLLLGMLAVMLLLYVVEGRG